MSRFNPMEEGGGRAAPGLTPVAEMLLLQPPYGPLTAIVHTSHRATTFLCSL